MDRYKVVEGSQSAHCCFEFTVVDTTKPDLMGDGTQYLDHFSIVCECFEREDADRIVSALNALTTPRWRYQGKEGWGDIWRETTIDPATTGFFESPDDWTVERL
jgi:hypothetical protein